MNWNGKWSTNAANILYIYSEELIKNSRDSPPAIGLPIVNGRLSWRPLYLPPPSTFNILRSFFWLHTSLKTECFGAHRLLSVALDGARANNCRLQKQRIIYIFHNTIYEQKKTARIRRLFNLKQDISLVNKFINEFSHILYSHYCYYAYSVYRIGMCRCPQFSFLYYILILTKLQCS